MSPSPHPATSRGMRALEGLHRPAVFAPVLVALGALLSLWFAQFRDPPADAGALLTAAAKILRGGVFYRDIDAYYFPGSAYLLALWMKLFGEHVSVARGLAAVVYCASLLALYATALALLERGRAALFALSLLSLKFVAWPSFTSYFYWDLAFCFGCIAVALLVTRPERAKPLRLAAAGACVGLAILSKQNLGIYLALAASALLAFPTRVSGAPRGSRRVLDLAAFAAGAAGALAPAALYFAWQGLLQQMLYSGLVRPFVGYLPTSGIPFAEPLAWWRLGEISTALQYSPEPFWQMLRQRLLPGASWYPAYEVTGEILARALYSSVPLAFGWALARRIRAGRAPDASEVRLFGFAILAAAIILSAFPRADFAHLSAVYAPVLLLLFALAEPTLLRADRPGWTRLGQGLEVSLVLGLLVTSGTLAAIHHAHLTRRMTLERADLYVYPNSYVESIVRFVDEELAPEEPFFVEGPSAQFYFLTGRFFPWPFSQLYPGQAGGDDGRALARLVDETRPRLVLRVDYVFPGLARLRTYTSALHAYLNEHYSRDPSVFQRHPLPGGGRPPGRLVGVWRRADATHSR